VEQAQTNPSLELTPEILEALDGIRAAARFERIPEFL